MSDRFRTMGTEVPLKDRLDLTALVAGGAMSDQEVEEVQSDTAGAVVTTLDNLPAAFVAMMESVHRVQRDGNTRKITNRGELEEELVALGFDGE